MFRMHYPEKKGQTLSRVISIGISNYETFLSNLCKKEKYNRWNNIGHALCISVRSRNVSTYLVSFQNAEKVKRRILPQTTLRKNHSIGSSADWKRVWIVTMVKGQSGCSCSHKGVCFPSINWGSTGSVILPRGRTHLSLRTRLENPIQLRYFQNRDVFTYSNERERKREYLKKNSTKKFLEKYNCDLFLLEIVIEYRDSLKKILRKSIYIRIIKI